MDDKTIYDTFSAFGWVISHSVVRDDVGVSKGYAFVGYSSFESADAAIAAMNEQYMGSQQISVNYAFKKDSKSERHGDEAERRLAALAASRSGSKMAPPPPPSQSLPRGQALLMPAPQPVPAHPWAAMYGGYAPPPMGMQMGMPMAPMGMGMGMMQPPPMGMPPMGMPPMGMPTHMTPQFPQHQPQHR